MDVVSERNDQPAAPRPDARAQRRRRIIRNTIITILAIPALIWLVLYITKGRFLKGTFESVVGRMTNREVRVGGDFQLYFAPWRIKFYAEQFTVANPAWATRPYLFRADRIDTRIAPLSLIFGKRRLYSLDLVNGAADLERRWDTDHRESSRLNWKDAEPAAKAAWERADRIWKQTKQE